MNYFHRDASALVKRYVPEIGTPVVNHLFTHVVFERVRTSVAAGGVVT